MKKLWLLLLLLPVIAVSGIPQRFGDGLIVGTYLYPKTDGLDLGSSTYKWNAWLNTINGTAISLLTIPTGSTTTQYFRGGDTPAWATLDTSVVPENGSLFFTNARARAAISVGSGLGYDATYGAITCVLASGSTAGCLSSSDWTAFNNKVDTVGSFGSTPNSGGASISGNTLTLQPGSSTQPGGVSTAAQDIGGEKTFHNAIVMKAMGTQSNPAAGYVKIYPKTDKKYYSLDSDGVETELGGGGGTFTGFAAISGGNSGGTYGSFDCEVFTSTGTLTVSTPGPVMFVLVAGGGSASHGGGGGGGVIDHYWEDVMLEAGTYPVTIGAGGVGQSASGGTRGTNGGDTSFAGFTAIGGGAGGAYGDNGSEDGATGGSGGGGGGHTTGTAGSGTYNKPEVQGYAGAASPGASGGCWTSSGGGGAGGVGAAGSSCNGGNGGPGLYSVVATLVAGGTPTYLGGGGGGGQGNSGGSCAGSTGSGGTGGGGSGAGGAGTANTGGGGTGACSATGGTGGSGGSGKAIICARIAGS